MHLFELNLDLMVHFSVHYYGSNMPNSGIRFISLIPNVDFSEIKYCAIYLNVKTKSGF